MNEMAYPQLVRVEADRYSPVVNIESPSYITVRVSKSVHNRNVYWQQVEPSFSLLELGFDANSGRLVSCSVPLFNGSVRTRDGTVGDGGIPGTPIFDMELWTSGSDRDQVSTTVQKVPGRIRLDQYSDALVITISPGEGSTMIVSGHKLAYCFGRNGRLQSIHLCGCKLA
jgi:hypothetical protein